MLSIRHDPIGTGTAPVIDTTAALSTAAAQDWDGRVIAWLLRSIGQGLADAVLNADPGIDIGDPA